MTSDATQLVDLSTIRFSSHIHTTDNTLLLVTQFGRLTSTSTACSSLVLPDVHHILGLALNLISVNQLTDHGLTVTFTSSVCYAGSSYRLEDWD